MVFDDATIENMTASFSLTGSSSGSDGKIKRDWMRKCSVTEKDDCLALIRLPSELSGQRDHLCLFRLKGVLLLLD
jgi:hypothetical protein